MNDALSEWVKKLQLTEMPVFGAVALEVSRLLAEADVPTSRLANVILQDASMTARVLRVSNSALYPKLSQITTVSRAITILGLDVVGRICLSVALVDSLLKGKPQSGLLKEMARSFYAAAIARTMAEKRRDESPEEVFIATLLYRLGAMAFWCYGGATALKLEGMLEEPQVDRRKAEKTLLGFHLSELTLALAGEWNLGELLRTALRLDENESGRSKGIRLAHELTGVVCDTNRTGERRALIRQMARHAQVSVETMEEIARENSNLAAEFARKVGAELAVPEIPGQSSLSRLTAVKNVVVPDADPQLQLKVLRELVMLSSGDPDPGTVIQLALEGMYRGVGLDRVVFLSVVGHELVAQYALAADQDHLVKRFRLSLIGGNVFSDACRDDQSVWAPILPESERVLLPEDVQDIVQSGPFLLAPLTVRNTLIGALYADRLASGRALDKESSESFELFAFQLRQVL